jgi:hypothetical protein
MKTFELNEAHIRAMIRWLKGLTEDQEQTVNLFMTILLSTGFVVSTTLNPFIIAFYR